MPSASVASSITLSLYFLATARIETISAIFPKTCTTIIALTILSLYLKTFPSNEHLFSQNSPSLTGSIHKLSSQSMKTGVANWYLTGFTAAIKVSGGTRTVSPGLTPASTRERCSALVPLWHAATFSVCRNSAIFCSSLVIYAPPVETQPWSIASSTYFLSFPSKLGIDNGINLFIINLQNLIASCYSITKYFNRINLILIIIYFSYTINNIPCDFSFYFIKYIPKTTTRNNRYSNL